MRYLPHTDDEIRAMLATIGVQSIDDLFADIPKAHRLGRPLAVEPALDEPTLMAHLEALASKNEAARALSFLGAGIYDHHVPPAVDQLLLRSEFYTAYTPYQAEVSQGTLQSIFEFQTTVCELLGMEVSNASMYDAASAVAEAALMARRVTGKKHVILSGALHPEYVHTVQTYVRGFDSGEIEVRIAKVADDGRTDVASVVELLDGNVAAVIVGYPNFFGAVEDLATLREKTRAAGALLVTATAEPYALSVIKPPGAYGVDIAVGEGQPLACPPQLGGPGVGLFATKMEFIREMPGRICGETVDQAGERGFVLTLSTREQHIRRERATSNICTNHGLIALAMTIRCSMLGKKGFEQVGRACLAKAEYLKKKIAETGRFTIATTAPTFNEFVVRRNDGAAAPLLAALAAKHILAGVDLGKSFPGRERELLVAVTERHSKEDLDRFVAALSAV
ncbi:aminomethyl-transferring glycine dehydrogenase subunit GcvPA [Sandaracinus amylolyticus]|nr:aminomethyl-transferring glycine dehydrogenase subunit GcvPA [Sandaracinus amylolyticus]